MKRQDQQTPFQRQMARDYLGVVIPIFETVLWREPGPHVLKFKEKWGVGIWAGRDNLADMHIILTRQGALTARSIRRLAPSEATDLQLLLAVKGHPGRLKAMTDDPGVLPLPPSTKFDANQITRTRSSAGYSSRTSTGNANRRSGREQTLRGRAARGEDEDGHPDG